MEKPVPDLQYYMRIAKNKGISEEHVREELIDLINETKSYIGAMQILIKRINNNEGVTDLGRSMVSDKKQEVARP